MHGYEDVAFFKPITISKNCIIYKCIFVPLSMYYILFKPYNQHIGKTPTLSAHNFDRGFIDVLVNSTEGILQTLSQTFIVFFSSKSGNCVYICKIKPLLLFRTNDVHNIVCSATSKNCT